MSLVELISLAPLTLLLKFNGRIRPIDVGSIWTRMISKVAILVVDKDVAQYHNEFKFGVGVLGGVKATWRWLFDYAHGRFLECIQLSRPIIHATRYEGDRPIYFLVA